LDFQRNSVSPAIGHNAPDDGPRLFGIVVITFGRRIVIIVAGFSSSLGRLRVA
jgi:hypothetical protein